MDYSIMTIDQLNADPNVSVWLDEVKYMVLTCYECGTIVFGPEPELCCSGRECGCGGEPNYYPHCISCDPLDGLLSEPFKTLP